MGKTKRKLATLFIIIGVLNLLWIIPLGIYIPHANRTKRSIIAAASYLSGLQNDSGLFYDFPYLNFSDGYTHVYSHAYILDSLVDAYLAGFCNRDIIEKGRDWILSQQQDGLWTFRDIVPLDSDDSAIVSVALLTYDGNRTPLMETMEQF